MFVPLSLGSLFWEAPYSLHLSNSAKYRVRGKDPSSLGPQRPRRSLESGFRCPFTLEFSVKCLDLRPLHGVSVLFWFQGSFGENSEGVWFRVRLMCVQLEAMGGIRVCGGFVSDLGVKRLQGENCPRFMISDHTLLAKSIAKAAP